MTPTDPISIIGAGIGGLTLAGLLANREIPFHLDEALSATPSGAAIALAPNAMWVLRRMDLAPALEASGTRISRYQFRTPAGHVLKEFSLSRAASRWGESAWCVPRVSLIHALAEKVPAPSVAFGHRLQSLKLTEAGGLALYFDDGEERTSPRLVGADGLHSIVRRTLYPDVEPRFRGFHAIRGVAHMDLAMSDRETAHETWGAGQQFGYSQMGEGAVYWYATWRSCSESVADEPERLAHQYFDPYADPIPRLLETTSPDQMSLHAIYDLPPLAHWQRGPVVLLGDAAHAMTPNLGQGGCQAIVDAWVLAQVLDRAEGYERYEAIRRPVAERIRHLSRTMGWLGHSSPPISSAIRRVALPVAPKQALARAASLVVGRPEDLGPYTR